MRVNQNSFFYLVRSDMGVSVVIPPQLLPGRQAVSGQRGSRDAPWARVKSHLAELAFDNVKQGGRLHVVSAGGHDP